MLSRSRYLVPCPLDWPVEERPAPARSVKIPGFVQPEGKEQMQTFLIGNSAIWDMRPQLAMRVWPHGGSKLKNTYVQMAAEMRGMERQPQAASLPALRIHEISYRFFLS